MNEKTIILNNKELPSTKLIIFYDACCPLCLMEMQSLAKRDVLNNICFFNIHDPVLNTNYPDIDFNSADRILHGKLACGKIITGLDVTHRAWQLTNKGWLTAPLRWSILKAIADKLYLLFARHRFSISYWLTGKKRLPISQQIDDSCVNSCQVMINLNDQANKLKDHA